MRHIALLVTVLAGAARAAQAGAPTETLAVPGLGRVAVYAPAGAPREVVLFVSGDGGWNLGVVAMAERLRDQGALVAGVDIRAFLKSMEAGKGCAYPAGALEELSRALQLHRRLPSYQRPLLAGYSSGATLVYAALAAAPPETFAGALSLGFCPDLEIHKAPCALRGLAFAPKKKGVGYDLAPAHPLARPWVVLQGESDQVCPAPATRAFVGAVGAPARLVALPKVGHGFSVTRNWDAAYVDAFRSLTASPVEEPPWGSGGEAAKRREAPSAAGRALPGPHSTKTSGGEAAKRREAPSAAGRALPGPHSTKTSGGEAAKRREAPSAAGRALPGPRSTKPPGIEDLSLVEVPARGPEKDLFAVMVTGDGGWAEIDKGVAGGLAAAGVPVVGWSSLTYYWTPRTPEAAAADLHRIVEHYAAAWKKARVLLVGYSFGADVLPFVANRLPAADAARVAGVALLGLSGTAAFEFHVSTWIGSGGGPHYPTVPEVKRLRAPALCVKGAGEDDSPCAGLASATVQVAEVGSGHHFGGDYARLAALALALAARR